MLRKAKPCSICSHASWQEIQKAIVAGEPLSSLSFRFQVAKSSLSRHSQNHMGRGGRTQNATPRGSKNSAPIKRKPLSRSDGRCESCGQIVGDSENGRLEPRDLIRRVERMVWLGETVAGKALDSDDLRLVLLAQDRIKSSLDQLLRIHNMVGPDNVTVIDQRSVTVNYQKWPLESLQAISDFHSVLEAGGTVQNAVEAVLGHKEAPMLSAPRPEDNEAA